MRVGSKILSALAFAALVPAVPIVPAVAQSAPAPAIPDTPAGRQFTGWLEAFNSDDPGAFDTYTRREYPTWPAPPGATRGMRELTGGFLPVRVEAATDSEIVVLLKERDWQDNYARMTITVGPDGKIANGVLQGTPPPPDSAPVARMSEAEALAALRAKLDAASAAGRFSGAVRVARGGATVFEYASGQADREQGIANTLDTLFRIGSMNKMFTAVSILQLVEAGKVDLDAAIGTYLPDYPNSDLASRVTVKHLLTHTGGTGDIFGPEFFERRAELCETGDYLALYGPRDVAFAPGERFAYSNYGFVLLGAIVEAASRQDYYSYVRDNIYRPAGMAASDSLPESVAVPDRSIGYTLEGAAGPSPEPRPNTDTLPCRGSAAGGGYSTVGDLVRFSEALRSGKLLAPELLAAATTGQVAMGPGASYGYGFVEGELNGARGFGHSGGAPGMSAELMIFPELGYDIAVAANMDTPLANRFLLYLGARLPAE